MESNVDTSMVNASDSQNLPVVVSGVSDGGVDCQTVPAFVPGVTLPPYVPGTVPAVAASAAGGSRIVPPAFATSVTLPPQPPIVPVMQKNDQPKPPVFSGQNFKRWREQVMFYLTTLNLQRFLVEEPPTVQDDGVWSLAAVDSWRHSDYLSRNYLLTYLSDDLYSVYKTYATTKQCWDALEFKYKTQDAGSKKFIVGRFLDYKMVDGKSVDDQFRELEVVFHELQVEGMVLNEMFKVAAVIEKLPPSWIDFKNYLKHKRKDMNMLQLSVRLRIEEGNRKAGIVTVYPNSSAGESKVNVVEFKSSSRSFKGKKKNDFAPKANSFKKSGSASQGNSFKAFDGCVTIVTNVVISPRV